MIFDSNYQTGAFLPYYLTCKHLTATSVCMQNFISNSLMGAISSQNTKHSSNSIKTQFWVGWWEWNWGITLIQTKNEIITHLCLFFQNGGPEVKKKLEEVRLLESRKSARLIGHGNTDFSKLADFNIVHERKRLNSETSDMSSGTTR